VGAVPPSLGPLAGCKMSNMLAPCAAVINGCGSICQHWHLGGNGHCRRVDLRICDRRGAVPGTLVQGGLLAHSHLLRRALFLGDHPEEPNLKWPHIDHCCASALASDPVCRKFCLGLIESRGASLVKSSPAYRPAPRSTRSTPVGIYRRV
jgi:hypothetical protein